MDIEYLFNSEGKWICFKLGKYLFTTDGKWIGWFPWDECDAFSVEGKYLGTICPPNRIYFFMNKPFLGCPGFPGCPPFPGFPPFPGYAGYSPLPPCARDLVIL